jgi:hypothetical protein
MELVTVASLLFLARRRNIRQREFFLTSKRLEEAHIGKVRSGWLALGHKLPSSKGKEWLVLNGVKVQKVAGSDCCKGTEGLVLTGAKVKKAAGIDQCKGTQWLVLTGVKVQSGWY